MNATEIIEFILNKIGDIDDSENDMGILSLLKTELNNIDEDEELSDEDKAISMLETLLYFNKYWNERLQNTLHKFNEITKLNIQNIEYLFFDEGKLDLVSDLNPKFTNDDFTEINKAISELSKPKPKPKF